MGTVIILSHSCYCGYQMMWCLSSAASLAKPLAPKPGFCTGTRILTTGTENLENQGSYLTHSGAGSAKATMFQDTWKACVKWRPLNPKDISWFAPRWDRETCLCNMFPQQFWSRCSVAKFQETLASCIIPCQLWSQINSSPVTSSSEFALLIVRWLY